MSEVNIRDESLYDLEETAEIRDKLAEMYVRQEALRAAELSQKMAMSKVENELARHIGSVFPLRGVARCVVASNGRDLFEVPRRSLTDTGTPYFNAWYYRIGEVDARTVMLTPAEQEESDPRIGLVAEISSLAVATEAEIEAVKASMSEQPVQVNLWLAPKR